VQQVIIRDDDTSFFTRPALLERVYGRLWDAGIPVCIAVVPAQRGDVRVDHRPGKPYDPSIPPPYRGDDTARPVTGNRELCAYLNEKAREGLVEICQHGFSHAYMEFAVDDAQQAEQMLTAGRRILQTAFPDAPLQTFIAPYDNIAPAALKVVLDAGYNICTHSEKLAGFPAITGSYQAHMLPNGRALFTCDAYLFTHRDDPAECLQNARYLLQTETLPVICNHYWTFFYDGDDANDGNLLASWHAAIDEILDRQATTFSAFAGSEQ
jgi:hypothetical protein